MTEAFAVECACDAQNNSLWASVRSLPLAEGEWREPDERRVTSDAPQGAAGPVGLVEASGRIP